MGVVIIEYLEGVPEAPGIYWYVTKKERRVIQVATFEDGLKATDANSHNKWRRFDKWSGKWAGPLPVPRPRPPRRPRS